MKCEICGKGPLVDMVTLWRVNEKGGPGIWRCTEHLSAEQRAARDPETVKLADVIEENNVQKETK